MTPVTSLILILGSKREKEKKSYAVLKSYAYYMCWSYWLLTDRNRRSVLEICFIRIRVAFAPAFPGLVFDLPAWSLCCLKEMIKLCFAGTNLTLHCYHRSLSPKRLRSVYPYENAGNLSLQTGWFTSLPRVYLAHRGVPTSRWCRLPCFPLQLSP